MILMLLSGEFNPLIGHKKIQDQFIQLIPRSMMYLN
jgi:hypothetical protein